MDDASFEILKLKAAICPSKDSWPSGEINPSIKGDKPTFGGDPTWNALHSAADDARNRVTHAFAKLAAVEEDKKLSAAGKAEEKQKIAEAALSGLKASTALTRARESVDNAAQRMTKKIGLVVKPAETPHEASVHAQIRDRLAAMKEGRMSFLEKNATDPIIASAILTAPVFLSGLSDAEIALVKRRVELQAVGSEALEARDATVSALGECEQGLRNAAAQIRERAGLPKSSNGGSVG